MLKKISETIANGLAHSQFISNTFWLAAGFFARLGMQLLYFVIVARSLGSAEYGVFAGSLGLVISISAFVTWGSGYILIKNVSRNQELFPSYWGSALSFTLISAILLTFLAVMLGAIILPNSPLTIIAFQAIGEFFGIRFNDLSAQAFIAFSRLKYASIVGAFQGVFRFGSALLLLFLPIEKTATTWAVLYMVGSLFSGILGYVFVSRMIGSSQFVFSFLKTDWKEGFFFSVGSSAQGVYNDIDKAFLLRISGDSIVGAYSAAYRIIDAAFIPVRAIIVASSPRFFQQGALGLGKSLNYAIKLMPLTLGIGIFSTLGLLVLRPLVPFVLGSGYALSFEVVSWLAVLPVFRAINLLPANALTGAEFQSARSGIQVFVAILNIILNIILIPVYGWLGAVWSTLISDGILALVMWILIIYMWKSGVVSPNNVA